MLYYSKNSREKVAHYMSCGCLKMIDAQNINWFSTPAEARAAGYRLCNRCAPITQFLYGSQKAINDYCQQNGNIISSHKRRLVPCCLGRLACRLVKY